MFWFFPTNACKRVEGFVAHQHSEIKIGFSNPRFNLNTDTFTNQILSNRLKRRELKDSNSGWTPRETISECNRQSPIIF